MIHRFERARFIFNSQEISKNSCLLTLKSEAPLKKLAVEGGLFKVNNLEMQHVLIFSNIVGKLPVIRKQVHGKKKKYTLSLSTQLHRPYLDFALDKFVNELLPKVFDFKTVRLRRAKKKHFNYTFKLRNRYSPLSDFTELVDQDMYAKNKGLFLPLAYSFSVKASQVKGAEDYFRKIQLPFNFFKKRFKAAFDDKEDFSMLVYEYVELKKKKKMANFFTLLYNLILLLPLVSFLTLAIFGSFLGVFGAMLICFVNIAFVQLAALYLNYFISFRYGLWELVWYWVNVDGFELAFSFQFDSLTSIMFVVVSIVSFCVHFYSFVYMYSDPYLVRFLSYLSLFTFFMLVLVSASSFLVLFLGWEGVGVCSYLLIGFWSTRAQAGKAATKAFLVNKVGDLFFLSGIALVFLIFDTTDFLVLQVIVPYAPEVVIEVIVSFLLIGAVGKSAQVGLHTWLPDAMEGPTPVSALIHAATMVTAGVFLLIRCSVFLEAAPRILWLITIWGSLTVLIAGLIGSAQNDIKKIIAYSTCSQLGYMFAVLGMSYSSLGLFHLLNHAFFKALLFLGAGAVIHLMAGEQDTRRMGGITVIAPGVYINMLLATLSLAGFPFLAGFYSKDIIIETSLISLWTKSHFIYWLLVFGALLTASYSIKLLERVFWNDFIGYKNIVYHKVSTTPLELCVFTLLVFLGACSGYYWKDLFLGFGTAYFSSNFNWLGGEAYSKVEVEFLSIWIKLFPCFFVFLAVELESRLLECKWYFNELINGYLVLPNLYASRHIFEQYEKRLLENNGPLFITELMVKW